MAGTDVWVWVGHVWSDRTQLALDKYGDRITDVSIFGWLVDAQGALRMTFNPTKLDYYRAKWPHIRFWAGFRNDGIGSIFEAIMNSTAAQTKLVDDLRAILVEHPWLHGIDIDLEKGGASSNATKAETIFRKVANLAHSRGKKCSAALPPLTATGSVGGEHWVRYKQLGNILDHMEIMSYDFAWSGSAPGPPSPGFWMRNVYDWAVSQVDRKKISWGLPLYAYFWDIDSTPSNPNGWRGSSGPFYAAYGYFSGHLAINGGFSNPAGDGSFDRLGWIVYRDEESQACWGLLECYDWLEPTRYLSQTGLTFDWFENARYGVRYGRPSGTPRWSIADNGPGSAKVNYEMLAREAINHEGQPSEPQLGYNFTVELVQRVPMAATIIDDTTNTATQLRDVYNTVDGSWSHWKSGTYSQYRGSGRLNFAHSFGSQALYVQARFQFAQSGTFRLHCKGITAEVTNSGRVRLLKGATVLDTTYVEAAAVGAGPGGSARVVLGLRVREGTARVYFSRVETNVPRVLEVNTTPSDGVAGVGSSNTVWIDHLYLGDGWYYQPREAVDLTLGSTTKTLGRIPRTGVTWQGNMFRPNSDVDEVETRDKTISLDWDYVHWMNAPVTTNQELAVQVVPKDHDTWLGRLFIVNADGASIAYWTDGDTIAYWRAVAALDYKVAGIALWTVGQEDLRIWDVLGGGELDGSTRVVHG